MKKGHLGGIWDVHSRASHNLGGVATVKGGSEGPSKIAPPSPGKMNIPIAGSGDRPYADNKVGYVHGWRPLHKWKYPQIARPQNQIFGRPGQDFSEGG